MEETTDYFQVKAISNSSLSYIDPSSAGNPVRFKDFFVEKQEEEKSYYRLGHLIHKWAEDRENFRVSEVPRPSEVMGVIADRVIEYIEANGEEFTRELASDISIAMNYQPKWKPDTRLKNIYDGIELYVRDFLERDPSKIYLTIREAETVEKCVEAVEKHPVAKDLLFMQDTDFSNKKVFKELEVYWNKEFVFPGYSLGATESDDKKIILYFKAKLDSLVIDFDSKIITYTDPKTTSGGAYGFSESFEKYKYYRQQAFYNWAIREFCKQQGFDITYFEFKNYNIAIETNGLFQVVVYNIPPRWIDRGKTEYQNLIKRIVEHEATNQWNYSLEEVKGNLVMELPFKEN